MLEEYLQSYSGCLIVVSHDRYFMDKVADHLFVFEGDGKLKDFPAGYSRYLEWKELKESEEQGQTAQAGPDTAKGKVSGQRPGHGNTGGANAPVAHASPASSPGTPSGSPATGNRNVQKRKLSFNEKRELEQLERQIPELEAEKAALETEMSSGTLPIDELTAKSLRISELIEQIDEASMRWLELSDI